MEGLKDGGEDAGGGLGEFFQWWSVIPLLGVEEGAVLLVVEENVASAPRGQNPQQRDHHYRRHRRPVCLL